MIDGSNPRSFSDLFNAGCDFTNDAILRSWNVQVSRTCARQLPPSIIFIHVRRLPKDATVNAEFNLCIKVPDIAKSSPEWKRHCGRPQSNDTQAEGGPPYASTPSLAVCDPLEGSGDSTTEQWVRNYMMMMTMMIRSICYISER